MLRHSCGYKLANDGQDTRAIQHYLGHKSINSTACGHVLTLCLTDPPCFGALRFSTLGPACRNAWWQIS